MSQYHSCVSFVLGFCSELGVQVQMDDVESKCNTYPVHIYQSSPPICWSRRWGCMQDPLPPLFIKIIYISVWSTDTQIIQLNEICSTVIKSQHSPWRTTAFSEGLAAMMLLSCCSMSLRWFSDGSTSLHTDYTSQNIQIHKCVTKSKPVLYKYFHHFKFSGTNISPWCRLVLHLHLLCPYWKHKPVSLTFLQTLK